MRSAIVAPMRSGERVHGVISLVTSDSRRELHAGDLAFVEDLALRAGAAVENARLYSEQAHTAQTLQDSLLPSRLPELARFRAASSYRAGGAGNTVGGDFYDLFAVGDGVMVLLGDVTGKGVDAAAADRARAPHGEDRGALRRPPVRGPARRRRDPRASSRSRS